MSPVPPLPVSYFSRHSYISEPCEPSVNYISGYRYQGHEIEGQVIHAWSSIQKLQVEFETWKSNVKYRIFHFNVKCQIQNLDVKFKTSMSN